MKMPLSLIESHSNLNPLLRLVWYQGMQSTHLFETKKKLVVTQSNMSITLSSQHIIIRE